MDFDQLMAMGDDELIQCHLELEDEKARAEQALKQLEAVRSSSPDDLPLMATQTYSTNQLSALLEVHVLVLGILDTRDVRYPGWERYNR